MLCRNSGQTSKGLRRLIRVRKSILTAAVALGLAGCGGHVGNFDTPNETGFSTLAHQLGFKSNDTPATNDTPAAPGKQVRHIVCPEVLILEGTAASQASPANTAISAASDSFVDRFIGAPLVADIFLRGDRPLAYARGSHT